MIFMIREKKTTSYFYLFCQCYHFLNKGLVLKVFSTLILFLIILYRKLTIAKNIGRDNYLQFYKLGSLKKFYTWNLRN